ncbi:MAG: hypothetical protein KDK34_08470, partial [Leptospiraceae bacterium]|nr:hypothetical protein [Leptospiraceae bacterium]
MQRRKILVPLLAMALLMPATILAEDDLPDASVDIEAAFVSNYVWRGIDYHSGRAIQEQKAYGPDTGAWAFQPSITFNTPVEGLYANIWGSFAMEGREDEDVDGVFQTTPGGTDILANASGGPAQYDAWLTSWFGSTSPSHFDIYNNALGQTSGSTGDLTTPGVPKQYKEQNGLKRSDEIDLTIGYERETSVGTMGFGIVTYTGANPVGKYASQEEMFISYAPSILPIMTLSIYKELEGGPVAGGSGSYYSVSFGDGAEVSEGIEVFGSVNFGYSVRPQLQGWQDVTASAGVSLYGFTVSYNIAYRPDMRLHDNDYYEANQGGEAHEDLPVWILGR